MGDIEDSWVPRYQILVDILSPVTTFSIYDRVECEYYDTYAKVKLVDFLTERGVEVVEVRARPATAKEVIKLLDGTGIRVIDPD